MNTYSIEQGEDVRELHVELYPVDEQGSIGRLVTSLVEVCVLEPTDCGQAEK